MFNIFNKKCVVCGENKSIKEFYSNRDKCKDCYNKAQSLKKNSSLADRLYAAYANQKERTGKLTAEDNLTVEDLITLLEAQKYACAACGEKFDGFNFQIAHIVSIANGGHLTLNNIQLVCSKHNGRGKAGTKNILYMRANIKSTVKIKTN